MMKAKRLQFILLILALLGILLILYLNYWRPVQQHEHYELMIKAATIMEEATSIIKAERDRIAIPIDKTIDINSTGLIGYEFSEITTSNGDLEAKRTTSNADFAALMVLLLKKAGLTEGDTIAIGASGSFPGALIATLSAAKAMGLHVVLITSYGSSSFGANIADFTIVHMYESLKAFFPVKFYAFSLGGTKDLGIDMLEEGREVVLADALTRTDTFIFEPTLAGSITKRLEYYHYWGEPLSVFVNIGGADANIGQALGILDLKPGLNFVDKDMPLTDGGVVFALGKEGIPIINILNIKTLALQHGLKWDPIGIDKIGKDQIYYSMSLEKRKTIYTIGLIFYTTMIILSVIILRKDKK